MTQYILSIDQSTSATKAFIFDASAAMLSKTSLAHKQYYPQEGYAEHDALEIYENTLTAIANVIADANLCASDISAISISNQRETALVWNKTTGKPIYHAIVWQCNRPKEICESLENQGFSSIVKEKTGLVLSPFFSAGKLSWIMRHVEGARQLAEKGHLLCGTMDSWLIWKLTGGQNGGTHATDYSNASRTQLFNIHSLSWDQELLDLFEVPRQSLPDVKYSDEIFGYAKINEVKIPITGVMGDSHAAFFAQNCFERGQAKVTYGTGSSVMMNIGDKPLPSRNGIVTSIGYGFRGNIKYVFEGNINATGATIKWLADNLHICSVEGTEAAARSVNSSLGVYIVPAFTGLGAPYWDNAAKALICGITFGCESAHIVRAALESIAYQIRDVAEAMSDHENGLFIRELRADGGPTANAFLMQFQSDLLSSDVTTNQISELSALGCAFMGGITSGIFKGLDEIKELRKTRQKFQPSMPDEERSSLYKGWKMAVKRARLK